MKTLLALILTTSFSTYAAKCEKMVEKEALKRINLEWDGDSVETRSISGVKLIHEGPFLETYAIAVSDEVEPSEWIMLVDTNVNKKKCAVKAIAVANDGSVSDIWE